MASTELPDPARLAARQLRRDLRRMGDKPHLLAFKRQRMDVSPFHFLRGTAPLFYEALRAAPQLAVGPKGKGWLAGDLHLENFGAYRPEPVATEGASPRVVFDVNDFDDAFVGPQRLDALRLLTSAVLASRDWGLSSAETVSVAEVLLEGVLAGRSLGRPGPAPSPVRELLERVAERSRRELLDQRTRRTSGGRRFLRGPRYRSLSAREQRRARVAFAAYAERLSSEGRGRADAWEVRDVAFRLAGTGSLGGMRIAVLVAGKGGPDGAWMFEMKEQGASSGRAFAEGPPERGAERVLAALRRCPAHPPSLAGSTDFGRRSMLVRRLTPQEDRLDLGSLPPGKRESALFYFGALSGALHRRGAKDGPSWKAKKARVLIVNAMALAGLHEAAAVHYAMIARDR
jgi:uncharacterized protein (DUF2252 family)